MSWMDILKATRIDNEKLIDRAIEYIEKVVEDLPNMKMVRGHKDTGKYQTRPDENADAKVIGFEFKNKELGFIGYKHPEADQKDFTGMIVEAARKVVAASDEKELNEKKEMLRLIGAPIPEQENKESVWSIELTFVYDFFDTEVKRHDITDVIEDLKLMDKARESKDWRKELR